MEGTLIKTEVNYLLKDEQFNVIIATTSLKKEGLALSLKNCQAIENGYDLDELAKEYMKISSLEFDAFKSGFQKALEILGDKKFSEEDIKKAFEMGEDFGSLPFSSYTTSKRLNKKEYIESLQQTKWDVEIEMDILNEYNQPKLNTDGCLILKRKI